MMSGLSGSTPSPLGSGPTPPLNIVVNNGPISSNAMSSPSGFSPNMMGNASQKRPAPASGSLDSSSAEVLDKKRLQELVKEVDPNEQLDEDVESMLLQIADDFIEQTVSSACALAKHRKANNIEVEDVQFVLEKNWNMWLPGFGFSEIRHKKRSATTEAHKSRMALIRKSLRKY